MSDHPQDSWSYGPTGAFDTPHQGASASEGSTRPAPAARLRSPELDERFEIQEELGRGGMGSVFRALERNTGREIALKVLHRRGGRPEGRFRREGQIAASLDHPGIVRVHGADELDGVAYISYALVEGRTLDEVLPELSPRQAAETLRDVARALEHAHQVGIVHRDVKPSNVLIDRSGRALLTDFGIAAAEGLERLTLTGELVGTPATMAPEQFVDSRKVGPWTDVWALGVILYQALTGRVPFEADSLMQLAQAVERNTPPPPSKLVEVPAALEGVCMNALRTDHRERYADAGVMADDLDAFLRGERVRRRRRPLPTVSVAFAALALALVGGLAAVFARPPAPDAAPTAASVGATRSTSVAEEPTQPAHQVPAWFAALPDDRRPALPLPDGLRFGEAAGEYVNDVDESVLVWVKAPGSFLMGGKDREESKPVHSESLAESYFLGKYEVSYAQYTRFCIATGHEPPPVCADRVETDPAVNVSWYAARAYCRWAGLNLPSEAEWEYAARGEQGRVFPWGNERDVKDANYNSGRDVYAFLAPVDAFPDRASPFGCLNMAGNAREWVINTFRPYSGSQSGDAHLRVLRGGSWSDTVGSIKTYSRSSRDPDEVDTRNGFRVARSRGGIR